MYRGEKENLEFKELYTPDIYKEVVAFANTEGGTILVGVNKQGEILGLDDPDEESMKCTNGIRDNIHPDVTIFTKCSILENRTVQISVNEGLHKPYYLVKKGMKPSGVYIRQGTSSVPCSEEQIRRMIKESDGDVFIESRSMDQDLTFHDLEKKMKETDLEFNASKFLRLGLTDSKTEEFTNLARVLSDQSPWSIKIGVYKDIENTIFIDAREFIGSALTVLDLALEYITLLNKTSYKIGKKTRVEQKDFPDAAIREALINAIVHRDYTYNGSIMIAVNESGMAITSFGDIPSRLTVSDISQGISLCRNHKLADLFHRLKYIEAFGTGIRRIYQTYRDSSLKPEISVTENTFQIWLPSQNYKADQAAQTPVLSVQHQEVLNALSRENSLSMESVMDLLSVKSSRANQILKEMKEAGLITITGRGKNKWIRAEH